VIDLAGAVVRLRAAGCVFAEDEAAVLGAAATDAAGLDGLVRRRAAGEPLEQVVGYADFCGVRVRLRPGVFVPRVRSELLVRKAAEEITKATDEAAKAAQEATEAAQKTPKTTHETTKTTEEIGKAAQAAEETEQTEEAETPTRQGEPIVVDLCCGSGALGMAVRHQAPQIRLFAADSDPVAVACARDNLGPGVFQGDLFAALPPTLRGRVNLLLANVPYVATRHIPLLPAEARLHEPHTALDGGDDGLDVFRAVVAEAPQWLAPGGLLLSEITEAQADAAVAAVRAAGLRAEIGTDDDLEAMTVSARRTDVPGVTPLR
jgi:release factor glutamine methyltransferase